LGGTSTRYSTTPVDSRPKRLRWTSSGGSGMSCITSRALSVPSMRESRKPSVGVRAMRWKRSRGSLESPSTRSMSPRL
jgi:hypothetical protein